MPESAAPEPGARERFLAAYKQDLLAGRIRALSEYQALFPGHDESLADEWRWLEPDAAVAGDADARTAAHQRIGDYTILAELGRGAQATVYLAEHAHLRRQVALKVLRAPRTDGTSRSEQRFRREAEVTASLEHPNICSVYEAGTSDGAAWIAMQYVPGTTLARLLAKGDALSGTALQLPAMEAGSDAGGGTAGDGPAPRSDLMRVVLFAEQAARALHAAHERGLVHRDIKPGNLMVAEDGRPVILDFGLARTADEQGLGLTRTTDVLGTPYYMAPEQLRRDGVDAVDLRADVYALGVTLFECLTRRRPFDAASVEALFQQILTAEPPPPRSLNPAIPRDLEVVMTTAIEKDPSRRYQTALELAEDLHRVRHHEPIRARPISSMGRALRLARRHPGIAASLASAVVSLVAGLAVSLWFLGQANAALGEADAALANWYDTVSQRAAWDNTRGRISDELVQLRERAVVQINRERPGFGRRLLRALQRVDDRAPDDEENAQRLLALLAEAPSFTDVGRRAMADMLHVPVQNLIGGLPFGWVFGVRLARQQVALLDSLPPTDARKIRARVLLLDGLNQTGGHEEAARLAAAWRDEGRDIHVPADHARDALFESRRGAALLAAGQKETALELLEGSVPELGRAFPGTWYVNMAKASLVEALEQTGRPSAAARRDLGASLRMSLGHRLFGQHPFEAARRVFGAPGKAMWDRMLALIRSSYGDLGDVEGTLRELDPAGRPNPADVDERAAFFYLYAATEFANSRAILHADRAHPEVGRFTQPAAEYVRQLPCHESLRVHVYNEHARYLLACGRFPEARQWLEEAIDRSPIDQRWQTEHRLGECLAEQGEYARAEVLLKRARDAARKWYGPDSPPAADLRDQLAVLYRKWGRIDDAVAWSGQEPGRRRQSPYDHLVLGATCLQFGALDAAEDAIRQALALDPGSINALRALAQVHLRRGRHDAAIAQARAARAAADAAVGSATKVADAQRSPVAAARWKSGAARSAIAGRRADRVLAMALFARDGQGDRAAALAAFEAAAQPPLRVDGNGFFSTYGVALDGAGQTDRARKLLESLTDARPGDPAAWHERARFLLENPHPGAADGALAEQCAETAVQMCKGKRAFIVALLAEAQFRAGHAARARQTAVAVVDLMTGATRDTPPGPEAFAAALEVLRTPGRARDAQWLSAAQASRQFAAYE